MTIRDMEEGDIPRLAVIYEQFWGETSDVEKMRRQFRKLENAETHIFLSAEEEGRLIGSVTGIVCGELYGQCAPFLVVENMIVDKDCRRQGAGSALLGELERRARSKGCSQMILVTESSRNDACGFYEAMGFPAGRNKGYKKKL